MIMLATLLLLSAIVSPLCDAKRRGKLRETAYLFDYRFCPGVEMACKGNVTTDYLGRDNFRITINCTFDQDYYPEKASFDVKKCTSRSLEDCQDYISIPVDDACRVFEEMKYYNSYTVQHIVPPFKGCPLRKGSYKLDRLDPRPMIPLAKKFFNFEHTDDSFIKNEAKLYSKTEMLFCLRFGVSFQFSRVTEDPEKTS